MRKLVLIAAVLIGAATPAQAALTLRTDPIQAFGTQTISIQSRSGNGPCGTGECAGSGVFDYGTIFNPYSGSFIGTQIADGPNGEQRFTFQDRDRSTTIVSLFYDQRGLFNTTLQGAQEFVFFSVSTVRFETYRFSASGFTVRLVDSETGATQVLAPVPEPSTWAMMLAGFAGIGLALRCRRRRKVAYS